MSENSTTNRTLAQAVTDYLKESGMTIEALSKKTEYSRSTISLYLDGKYNANPAKIEEALASLLEELTGVSHAMRINGKQIGTQHRGFFRTSDSLIIQEICIRAQEDHGLGMIIGKSGFGKTCTLKLLSKADKRAYIECDDSMSLQDMIYSIENAFHRPHVPGSTWQRVKAIRDFLNENPGWLLMVDEADKLISKNTVKKLEVLRGIFDQAEVGMVLVGEPNLERLVKNNADRLANRIDFFGCLQGLSEEEVQEFMSVYDVEPEALALLKRRAHSDKNGCFRLLNRTLRNCFRLMDEQGETRITQKVVKEASGVMML